MGNKYMYLYNFLYIIYIKKERKREKKERKKETLVRGGREIKK